ncbi:hypothetical protein HK096_007758, partial [Nowakowskiella sp. JEL0078]
FYFESNIKGKKPRNSDQYNRRRRIQQQQDDTEMEPIYKRRFVYRHKLRSKVLN